MHEGRHGHRGQEKETGGPENKSNEKEKTAHGFREGGHQSPENGIGTNTDKLHRLAEFDPEIGPLHEFRKSVCQEGESDQDAEKKESGITVFA